jgi:hypothetical protein
MAKNKLTLGQTFKAYTKLAVVVSIGGYLYLDNRCKNLKKEYMDFDLIQLKKDQTRPSNVFYGLNWGYRADETIEKNMDTGDLLFFNYNCLYTFHPMDMLKCYIEQQRKG